MWQWLKSRLGWDPTTATPPPAEPAGPQPGPLAPGDGVFVRKRGFFVVVGQRDGGVEVRRPDDGAGSLTYRDEQVRRLFRPPMDRAVAEGLLGSLGSPAPAGLTLDGAGRTVFRSRIDDALAEGDGAAMVALLREAYAVPDEPALRESVRPLEDAVFFELSHVLDQPFARLRKAARQRVPLFGSRETPLRDVSIPDPPAATPDGWTWISGFHAFGGIVVGDFTSSAWDKRRSGTVAYNLRPRSPSGVWHALSRDTAEGSEIAVVHADHLAALEGLLGQRKGLGKVMVEGGRVCVVDREIRDDPGELEGLADGGQDPRGFAGSTGGDGAHTIRVARIGSKAVLVTFESS